MHEELLKRRKGERLSKEASKYIARILHSHPVDSKLIQKYYKLSSSTIKRVKLLYPPDDSNNVEGVKYLDAHNDLSKEAKELIKEYLEPP